MFCGVDEQAAFRFRQMMELFEYGGTLFTGASRQKVHHQRMPKRRVAGMVAPPTRFLNRAEDFVPSGNDNCRCH